MRSLFRVMCHANIKKGFVVADKTLIFSLCDHLYIQRWGIGFAILGRSVKTMERR